MAGGLLKNPLVMQIYSDVLRRPLHAIESDEGPALGAAMHAAVAAGVHPDIETASEAMGRVRRNAYLPDEERADAYDELYAHYSALHDHFGRGEMMHALRRPRRRKPRAVGDDRRAAARGLRAARRAAEARARRLDEREPLGARARGGPDGDQGERRRLRRP